MERISNPVTQILDIVRERKKVKLSALAYRSGLSQAQVLDILDALEREEAISRNEEEGEIVVQARYS
jgi:DNA-binding IclR family transcriptional regulator